MSNWHRVDFIQFAPPVDEWGRPSISAGRVELFHHTYAVLKETPKGVWLDTGFGGRRFVRRDAKRQWASPTFEQAVKKFESRKRKHIAILLEQVNSIKQALTELPAWAAREAKGRNEATEEMIP